MYPTAKVVSLIGRPRDHGRDEAIHRAAIEVLTEVGYDRTTIESIASRAQVSKATIYRRYKNKQEILLAAVDSHATCLLPSVDTGSLRGDLIQLITEHIKTLKGPEGELLMNLLTIAHRDPEFGKVLIKSKPIVADGESAKIFERALMRGEISKNANIDFLGDVIPSIFSHRIFVTHQPVDRKFIEQLVDDLIIPALKR